MDFLSIIWDEADDPDGNVQHIADHDLTIDDVEAVLCDPVSEGTSRSSGSPVAWGYTDDDRYIIVVYEQPHDDVISSRHRLRSPGDMKGANMAKRKLNRVVRSGKITPDEAARDNEIREKIQSEFPPATTSPASGALTESLRSAIEHNERSVYQIAKDAGVSQIMISRFLSGERDIRLATADKIARVLGLELISG